MRQIFRQDPYCPLFFIGFLAAIEGALLWTLFQAQGIPFYPRQAHAHLMIYGFLTAFISGFLITAVPRMTGSQNATKPEVFIASLWVLGQGILNAANLTSLSALVFVLQILTLIAFFARRFKLGKQRAPEGFVFIPFAFLSALVAPSIYLAVVADIIQSPKATHWLFLWTGQAFVLNLICGVGSRLIPVLSRLPSALPMASQNSKPRYGKMATFATLLNATFIIESFEFPRLGFALRTIWVLWFAIAELGILKTPTTRSKLGTGLKAGILFIIIGYALAALFPDQQLQYLHLVFVGGFSLMTLMVATRVVLAHGGQSTNAEISSPAITAVISLFVVSGIARTLVFPIFWYQGLLLAVVGFVLACSLWMLMFGRFVFSSRPMT